MTEIEILEKIILNFGNSAPYLVLVFLFLRFMWPNIYQLLSKYLDVREKMLCQPDPVAVRLDSLSDQVVRLISSLDMFVGEMRLTARATGYTTASISNLVEGGQKQQRTEVREAGSGRVSTGGVPVQEEGLRVGEAPHG